MSKQHNHELRAAIIKSRSSRGDVRSGDALTLPAVVPLMTFTVSVEGDDLYVDA